MSLRPHLVIAEDQDELRALLQRQLEGAGYAVTAVADGTAAYEAIRSVRPDLVVADWMMPGFDGLELCRRIRKLSEDNEIGFTYAILLTANSEKHHVVSGLEAGADDYLIKPYHAEELLARVRGGLRLSELQRKLASRNADLRRSHEEVVTLNRRLEELANFDDLTGLCNRRYFFERLDQAWNQARREQSPLACIMIDVDHFKQVNDRHGHAAGDLVLRSIAQTCRRAARSYDLIGRYGGEEFCAVLIPGDGARGGALAERMRTSIETTPIVVNDGTLHVTASFGVAMLYPEHESARELMADADELLYRAKQNGRNQVWIQGPGRQPERYSREVATAG